MYEAFYGLKERPFALTPNPEYIYYSGNYRAALEHLLFGLEHKEGFLLLVGPVGTGKTTLCRHLLDQLDDAKYETALIFNPFLNPKEMLQALLTEFGVTYAKTATQKELLDKLNKYLLEQLAREKVCVCIFDEAQHLSEEFLEQIRVLSNLETSREKLLQIVLAGQPELREKIQRPSLAQLDQRVSLRCTLQTLSREETERYIYHRLNVAGAQGRITFSGGAIRLIHRESGGIPRLINLICDRALLAGYVAEAWQIGPRLVRQGLTSLRGDDAPPSEPPRLTTPRRRRWLPVAALASVLAVALFAVLWYVNVL